MDVAICIISMSFTSRLQPDKNGANGEGSQMPKGGLQEWQLGNEKHMLDRPLWASMQPLTRWKWRAQEAAEGRTDAALLAAELGVVALRTHSAPCQPSRR